MKNSGNIQKKAIITGAAGFIGACLAKELLNKGFEVLGGDNLNASYDPALKKARVKMLKEHKNFQFLKADMAKDSTLKTLVKYKCGYFIHFAALAGVRQSFAQPADYTKANIAGFINALEYCVQHNGCRLIYASSSSVYGKGKGGKPSPLSYYGATKLADEIITETWVSRYGFEASGLRFCTVYGPWGRPDMAAFIFANKILKNQKVELFADGKIRRDFTYIDDVVNGITKLMKKPARNEKLHRVYDMGFGNNISIAAFLAIIEKTLGKKAEVVLKDADPSEPMSSLAPSKKARSEFGFDPKVSCQKGLPLAVKWFKQFYYPNS